MTDRTERPTLPLLFKVSFLCFCTHCITFCPVCFSTHFSILLDPLDKIYCVVRLPQLILELCWQLSQEWIREVKTKKKVKRRMFQRRILRKWTTEGSSIITTFPGLYICSLQRFPRFIPILSTNRSNEKEFLLNLKTLTPPITHLGVNTFIQEWLITVRDWLIFFFLSSSLSISCTWWSTPSSPSICWSTGASHFVLKMFPEVFTALPFSVGCFLWQRLPSTSSLFHVKVRQSMIQKHYATGIPFAWPWDFTANDNRSFALKTLLQIRDQ